MSIADEHDIAEGDGAVKGVRACVPTKMVVIWTIDIEQHYKVDP